MRLRVKSYSNLVRLAQKVPWVMQPGFSVDDVPGPLREVTEVEVDFSGAPFITLDYLAVLALLSRRLAEAGIAVVFRWPRRSAKKDAEGVSLFTYLARMGFPALFTPRAIGSHPEWLDRIGSKGDVPALGVSRRSYTGYMPLRWVGLSNFATTSDEPHEVYESDWRLGARTADRLYEILTDEMGVDWETAARLVAVFVSELSLNAAMHSSRIPGTGIAVLGAQNVASPGEAWRTRLCVCDIGRGIPDALHRVLQSPGFLTGKSRQRPPWPDCIAETQAVWYSLQEDVTSRPPRREPPSVDPHGLSLVVYSLGEGDSFELRSGGGGLSATRESARVRFRKAESESMRRVGFTGTSAAVTIRQRAPMRISVLGPTSDCRARKDPWPPERVLSAVDPLGSITAIEPGSGGDTRHRRLVVVDVGFADQRVSDVIGTLDTVRERARSGGVALWNVSVGWGELTEVERWIAKEGAKPILVVRSATDAALLGAGPGRNMANVESIEDLESWAQAPVERTDQYVLPLASGGAIQSRLQVGIPLGEYNRVCKALNDRFISKGFGGSYEQAGFFIGDIHLPSGKRLTHFFALGANTGSTHSANRARWIRTAEGLVAEALSECDLERRPVVVGCGWPVESVMADALGALPGDPLGVSWRPLDSPRPVDFRGHVRAGDQVVLVADVVMSGSFARSCASVLRDAGAEVVGLVALVDARGVPGTSGRTVHSIDVPRIVVGATLPYAPGVRRTTEMSLDSITRLPMRPDAQHLSLGPKIQKTIDIVVASHGARIGHFRIMGRRTPLMVDVRTLLEEREHDVMGAVARELGKRLQGRDVQSQVWDHFQPTMIVHPTELARLVRLRRRKEHPVRGPAETFAELMRRQVGDVPVIPVERVVDATGRLEFAPAALSGERDGREHSALVVDDGMWTGRTAQALTRAAVNMGATRVVVMPLLARMGVSDLRWWEAIESVEDGNGGHIPVRFVFPLVLPVPFYNEGEAPTETTGGLLRSYARDAPSPVAEAAAEALVGLEAVEDVAQVKPADASYAHTWLRLRCGLELGLESDSSLAESRKHIEDARPGEPGSVAILRLFLNEQHLLDQQRIRRTVDPAVISLAYQCAVSPDQSAQAESGEEEERVLALALLRARYLPEFFSAVGEVAGTITRRIDRHSRLLVHLSTLRPHAASSHRAKAAMAQLVAAAEDERNRLEQSGDADRAMAIVQMEQLCRRIQERNTPEAESPPLEAAHALRALQQDDWSDGCLGLLRRLQRLSEDETWPSTDHPEELGTILDEWGEAREELRSKVGLPLSDIREVLEFMQPETLGLFDSGMRYLVAAGDRAIDGLASSLYAIDMVLEGLQLRGSWIPPHRIVLQESLNDISQHLLSSDSTLASCLQFFEVAPTIQHLVESASRTIEERGRSRGLAVATAVSQHSPDLMGLRPFFSPRLFEQWVEGVCQNLVTYAFPGDEHPDGTTPMVHIDVAWDEEELDSSRTVLVEISNNGHSLPEYVSVSWETHDAVGKAHAFGGRIDPPSTSRTHLGLVGERAFLPIW